MKKQFILTSKPLVSVLIPNFNKAPYLRNTLDSILAQTYLNWECIIVDDHSTDESWRILEDYSLMDCRFQIFRRPSHLPKGGNAARNFAFELSKGDYINWFDSDDVMKDHFIITKLLEFERGDYDAVICGLLKSVDGVETQIGSLAYFSKTVADYLVNDVHFLTSGPMFTRSFLLGRRLFNERIKVGQEKEFYLRLLCQGMKYVVISDFLGVYYDRSNSILNTYGRLNISFDHYRYRCSMVEVLFRYRVDISGFKSLVNLWAYKSMVLAFKEFRFLVVIRMFLVLLRNRINV